MRTLALLLAASLTLGGCARDPLTIAPDHPQVLSGEWSTTLREMRQLQGAASGPQGLYLTHAASAFSGANPVMVIERRSPQTGEVMVREAVSGQGVGTPTHSSLALRGDELLLLTSDSSGRRLTLHTLDPLTLRPLRAAVALPEGQFSDLLMDGEVLRLWQGPDRDLWLSTRTLEPLAALSPTRTRPSPDGGWWQRVEVRGSGVTRDVGRSGQEQGFRMPTCNSDLALLGLPGGERGERVVTLSCGRLQVFAQDGTLLQDHPLLPSPAHVAFANPQLVALPGGQVGYAFGSNQNASGRFDPERGVVTSGGTGPLGGGQVTSWGQVGSAGAVSWDGDVLEFVMEELPIRLVTRSTYLDARRHAVSGDLFLRGERLDVSGILEFRTYRSGDGFVPQGLPPGGHLQAKLEFPGGSLNLMRHINDADEPRSNPNYFASLQRENKNFVGGLRR